MINDTKKKILITTSVLILFISIGLNLYYTMSQDNSLDFEYINTKDIAMSKVTNKNNSIAFLSLLNIEDMGPLQEVNLPKKQVKKAPPKRIWYLPTEFGEITQYPSYGHVAYDITSPRGIYENVFPVANGVISSIYRDSAGANIVTIRHNINGTIYTSQYVHLSAYARGLYVGKPVTINDCIGRMGATGVATGVHLHIALLDNCDLGKNSNCTDLGSFFTHANNRAMAGYKGLGSVMNVPSSWTTR